MKTGTKVKGFITRITSDGVMFTFNELLEGFIPRQEFEQNQCQNKAEKEEKIEAFATKEIIDQKRVFSFVHITNSGRVIRSVAAKQPKNPPSTESQEARRAIAKARKSGKLAATQEKVLIEVMFDSETVKRHAPKAMDTEVFQGFIQSVEYNEGVYVLRLSKSTFLQNAYLTDRFALSYNGKPIGFQKQMKFWADGLVCTEQGEQFIKIKAGSAIVRGAEALGIISASEFSEKELHGLEVSNLDKYKPGEAITAIVVGKKDGLLQIRCYGRIGYCSEKEYERDGHSVKIGQVVKGYIQYINEEELAFLFTSSLPDPEFGENLPKIIAFANPFELLRQGESGNAEDNIYTNTLQVASEESPETLIRKASDCMQLGSFYLACGNIEKCILQYKMSLCQYEAIEVLTNDNMDAVLGPMAALYEKLGELFTSLDIKSEAIGSLFTANAVLYSLLTGERFGLLLSIAKNLLTLGNIFLDIDDANTAVTIYLSVIPSFSAIKEYSVSSAELRMAMDYMIESLERLRNAYLRQGNRIDALSTLEDLANMNRITFEITHDVRYCKSAGALFFQLAQETNSVEPAKEAVLYLEAFLDTQPRNSEVRELREQVEAWKREYSDTRAEIIPLFTDRQHQTEGKHSETAALEDAQSAGSRDNIISLLGNNMVDGSFLVRLFEHPEDWPLISSKAFYLATGFEITEEELNELRTRTDEMRKEETKDNIIPLHETEE